MRAILLSCGLLAGLGAFALAAQAPPTGATAPSAAVVDPLLLQPPKTREEIDARLALATTRLEELRPSTQPATQPTDEAAAAQLAAQTALFQEWERYAAELRRFASLQESISNLSSDQHLQGLTAQLETLEQKTRAITRGPVPLRPSEAEVAEITTRYKELEAESAAFSALQARRAGQLTTGFKERRAALEAELKQFRQAQQAATTSPTTAPAASADRDLPRRLLDVQIARTELNVAALALEADQTQLLQKQDERQLEALRQYVAVFQQRMNAFTEARSRGTLEALEDALSRATVEHERAFLELQYFCERILGHYFKNQQLRNRLKNRFPTRDLDRLRERVSESEGVCEDMASLVAYRAGKEAPQLRAEVRQQRYAFQAELATLRRALGTSISELHEIQNAKEQTRTRFRALAEQLATAAESAPAAERTRLDTETTNLRTNLDEAIRTTTQEAQQLEVRLSEAVELVDAHLAKLRSVENELYWTALRRRESGLAGLAWSAAWTETRQLLGMPAESGDAEPGAPSLTAAGLAGGPSDARADLADRLKTLGEDLRRPNRGDWVRGVLIVVAAGAIAFLLRRVAKAHTELAMARLSPDAAQATADGRGRQFSARMGVLIWRIIHDAVLSVAVWLALGVAVWTAGLPRRTWLPLAAVVSTLLAVYVLLHVVRRLFAPKRLLRIVPCTDLVAAHYRYWCRVLLVFSLALLPVLLFLSAAQVAEELRALLWEVWKTGVLLMLLGFLVRKTRVVGCGPPAAGGWSFTFVSALYPLLAVVVLGLFILQLIGYGVLVEFLGTGVVATAFVALVIGTAVEYLCDLLDGVTAPTCPAPPGGHTTDAAASDSRIVSSSEPPSGATEYVARLLKSLLRVAGVVAAIVLTVYIWGGAAYFRTFDWWKLTLPILLIIVAALIIDRVVLTALRALRLSGRLPESTGNIIRRWTRGLLTLIVVLLAVTLAGYQIQSLWAPLSALLAMVAIGFVAVWSLLSNILATLMILIWRPFNVGERITLQPEGIGGRVIDINFLYTLLETDAGARITVPNAQFIQKLIQRERTVAEPQRSLAEQLDAEKPVGE